MKFTGAGQNEARTIWERVTGQRGDTRRENIEAVFNDQTAQSTTGQQFNQGEPLSQVHTEAIFQKLQLKVLV